MSDRASLLAKLRYAQNSMRRSSVALVPLYGIEIERLIADLEYCDFAHKALEGGELPQTLKKQAI